MVADGRAYGGEKVRVGRGGHRQRVHHPQRHLPVRRLVGGPAQRGEGGDRPRPRRRQPDDGHRGNRTPSPGRRQPGPRRGGRRRGPRHRRAPGGTGRGRARRPRSSARSATAPAGRVPRVREPPGGRPRPAEPTPAADRPRPRGRRPQPLPALRGPSCVPCGGRPWVGRPRSTRVWLSPASPYRVAVCRAHRNASAEPGEPSTPTTIPGRTKPAPSVIAALPTPLGPDLVLILAPDTARRGGHPGTVAQTSGPAPPAGSGRGGG